MTSGHVASSVLGTGAPELLMRTLLNSESSYLGFFVQKKMVQVENQTCGIRCLVPERLPLPGSLRDDALFRHLNTDTCCGHYR